MPIQVTKRQHYVWRAYLRSWVRQKQIYCLRENEIFPSNLMGVAQQRYFYRLQELNAKEKELIYRLAISESYGNLKEVNSEWLKLFTFVFDIKSKLESRGALPQELAQMFKDIELQLEESLHSSIEGRSKPYLNSCSTKTPIFTLTTKSQLIFVFSSQCSMLGRPKF